MHVYSHFRYKFKLEFKFPANHDQNISEFQGSRWPIDFDFYFTTTTERTGVTQTKNLEFGHAELDEILLPVLFTIAQCSCLWEFTWLYFIFFDTICFFRIQINAFIIYRSEKKREKRVRAFESVLCIHIHTQIIYIYIYIYLINFYLK